MARCPRCFNEHLTARWDNTFYCLLCGHEIVTIPKDVLDEVKRSMDKRRLGSSDSHLPVLSRRSKLKGA